MHLLKVGFYPVAAGIVGKNSCQISEPKQKLKCLKLSPGIRIIAQYCLPWG
jgi:hypothetical protein